MFTTGKLMGAGGARGNRVDFVASAKSSSSSNAISVAYPTTVLAGDVLLVCISDTSTSGTTPPSTPSGWTLVGFSAGNPWQASPQRRQAGALFYKIAGASEGSTTPTFSFNGYNSGVGQISLGMYRPSFSTVSVTVGDTYTSVSNVDKTITSGSATGYKGVVSCFAWTTYAPNTYCSMSPAATLDSRMTVDGGGQLLGVAFGATNVTVTVGSGNLGYGIISCYLSLS
jgi:hypothetical protein